MRDLLGALRKRLGFAGAANVSLGSKDPAETQFAEIVTAVHLRLAGCGYRKRRTKFTKMFGRNAAIIQFQRSQWNERGDVSFTLNTSIVSARLLARFGHGGDLSRASEADGHLRKRIGFYANEQLDTWWRLHEGSEATRIIREVMSLLELAIPYLEEHSSDEALLKLWQSGSGPGIMEKQRFDYLAEFGSL